VLFRRQQGGSFDNNWEKDPMPRILVKIRKEDADADEDEEEKP